MTRVLIADDDPLTAAGIEILLAGSNFQVVGNVRSGKEAPDWRLRTVTGMTYALRIADTRETVSAGDLRVSSGN